MSRSKDRRDIYYRLAKEQEFRARSAFKLLQIDETFEILNNVVRAVDLCSAPGSFSQVLARRIPEIPERRIISVDLNEISPIPGVTFLQGDITSEETALKIVELAGGQIDLITFDGAPDVSGMELLDQYLQNTLVKAALAITSAVLKPGGSFVAKIFRGRAVSILYAQLQVLFKNVHVVKPRSSRNSSLEAFVVCLDYSPPEGYISPLFSPDTNNFPLETQKLIPLLQCGDLSAFDSNISFEFDGDSIKPVQLPINPPYADVISKN
ncbi:hypothetical protein RCL1_001405 [Eukaryota sp. TZLM3-RCL]